MKAIVIKDKDIPLDDCKVLLNEFSSFLYNYTGIRAWWKKREFDYTSYPVVPDGDGDLRPTSAWLNSLTKMVEEEHGPFGIDHIFILVHEDNWKSDPPGKKGIWGTNYSYVFGKQHLHYCRWDKDNINNSFGTLYHEWMHSLDALTLQEIRVDVRPLVGVDNWDREIVHGSHPEWDYIRWRENAQVLEVIAPHLKKAYTERRTKDNQMQIISLLTKTIYWLRMLVNRKNGVTA